MIAERDEGGSEHDRVTPAGPAEPRRSHLLSVVLEDYFQVAPLKSVVHNDQWYRFERRVEENTLKALALLDEFGIHATFFVLGWIADEMPDLIREVAGRGHEVASKGYAHRSIRQLSRDGFRDDLRRSRAALERASNTAVHGYRIAHSWFSPEDLWALDVLIAEGYRYDSSVRPLFWRYAHQPWRRQPHLHPSERGAIWEFPLPSWTIGGWSFPISGGNYLRQLPHWLMKRVVAGWIRKTTAPFLMYFHVWELDPQQPRIRAVPLRERVRQYRNLEKMETVVRHYLSTMRFVPIADYLRLRDGDAGPLTELSPPESKVAAPVVERALASSGAASKAPITVVVPCYNEDLILPYLANTLRSVERKLRDEYDLRFIFVDDGSTDTTWASLNELFGERRDCVILRHQRNQGVAAAILTGLRAAGTDIVCSIDCDCTYDPHQLSRLIPLLVPGVDMVTASPYHRDGLVRNVPGWRLFLSKSLSHLYRLVLTQQLATYTSCFRVYRRAAVAGLQVREKGFLGVAEMLGLLDLYGARIVECPAVLEVRLLGRSKMKTIRTIGGHLRLLLRLGAMRAFGRRDRGADDPVEPSQ